MNERMYIYKTPVRDMQRLEAASHWASV